MLSLLVAISILTAEDERSGVRRADLREWINGPGKSMGKKEAERAVQTRQAILKAAKSGRTNSKLSDIDERTIGNRLVLSFPSNEIKRSYIDTVTKLLDADKEKVKNPPPGFPILSVRDLQVGRIGKLRRFASVADVDDNDDFQVSQVIDDQNLLARFDMFRGESIVVWMTMPTSGMVDDRTYSVGDHIYEVVETKQYNTALGTNTVFRVERRTVEELVKSAADIK